MSIAVKALALLMGACLFGIFLGALACKYDMKKGEQHMSKWEPSNAEMRQFFNDIHSISSSLKKLAATTEESTHTIKEFSEYIVRENEKFEREQKEGLEQIEREFEEKKRQEEAAKAFEDGVRDGLKKAWRYEPGKEEGTWSVIPIEPDPDERG